MVQKGSDATRRPRLPHGPADRKSGVLLRRGRPPGGDRSVLLPRTVGAGRSPSGGGARTGLPLREEGRDRFCGQAVGPASAPFASPAGPFSARRLAALPGTVPGFFPRFRISQTPLRLRSPIAPSRALRSLSLLICQANCPTPSFVFPQLFRSGRQKTKAPGKAVGPTSTGRQYMILAL